MHPINAILLAVEIKYFHDKMQRLCVRLIRQGEPIERFLLPTSAPKNVVGAIMSVHIKEPFSKYILKINF